MRIYDNPACFDRYAVVLTDVILIGSPCLKAAYQDTGKERPDGLPLGKRISLSELSGDFKKQVCNHMPLPNFRLPKAYSKFGAQVGRSNKAKGKCKLGKVRLYDGAYDIGGAYWGSPSDLYFAKSKTSVAYGYFDDAEKPGFSFVRANSPYEAICEFESMGLTF